MEFFCRHSYHQSVDRHIDNTTDRYVNGLTRMTCDCKCLLSGMSWIVSERPPYANARQERLYTCHNLSQNPITSIYIFCHLKLFSHCLAIPDMYELLFQMLLGTAVVCPLWTNWLILCNLIKPIWGSVSIWIRQCCRFLITLLIFTSAFVFKWRLSAGQMKACQVFYSKPFFYVFKHVFFYGERCLTCSLL